MSLAKQKKQNWLSRSDLQNTTVNAQYLTQHLVKATGYSANSTVILSHVPKTAGTTLESILTKNFPLSRSIHINAPDLNDSPEILTDKELLICGHHPIHGLLYQLLPEVPVFHITMLRNPLDRFISYYNYIKSKQDHALHAQLAYLSLDEFITQSQSPEISNGQARRFSGFLHNGHTTDDELFKLAKDNLESCFTLVLCTELFDESLQLLKQLLHIQSNQQISYQRKNRSQKFITISDLTEPQLTKINNMNQADNKLFDWAKQQCLQLIGQHANINPNIS